MVGRSKVRLEILAATLTAARTAGVLAVCLSCCGLVAEVAVGQGTGRHGAPQLRYVAQNTPSAGVPATEELVLKAYPYRADGVAAMATRLSAEFRDRPNIRVVLDERTSQILVMAPPSIHAQIEARIKVGPQSAPTLAPPPPAASGVSLAREPVAQSAETPSQSAEIRSQSAEIRSRSVELSHISGQQLDADLMRMLGSRLAETRPTEPGLRNYQLSLPHGTVVQLAIDQNTNRVHIQGTRSDIDACVRLIEALDAGQPAPGGATRIMTLESASPEAVRRAIGAIQSGKVAAGPSGSGPSGRMVSMLFQQGEQEEPPATSTQGEAAPSDAAAPGTAPPQREGSLIGPVQIEMLEGLDVLVIRGHLRDVEQVIKIIEEIEQISLETEPTIEVYPLHHTNSASLAALLAPLYEEVFSPRQGTVSITALVKPNALLLVGRVGSVETVKNLVKRLDRPVPPETQFRVFRLKFASAWTAHTTLEEFFSGEDAGEFEEQEPGLKTRVLVTADYRSNSLIVRASPRDMLEVERLIERIDTADNETSNELRVFKLKNSMAEDLAPILQEAINSETSGGQGGAGGGVGSTPQGAAAGGGRGGIGSQGYEQKATMLTFTTMDRTGRRELQSGILIDVRITADPRANALIVSAPKNSMELIAAVIEQLDQLPAAETQIKVFTIVNSDAADLLNMLETLFGQQATATEPLMQTSALEGESSLVSLRFAVDIRTNSIIASGSLGDLSVIEAILLRLDDAEVRHRKSTVYLLKNAPAADVAAAITEFLSTEQSVLESVPGVLGVFEQIEREVVVVAEPVRNALLISATPRFYDEVMELVMKLDEQPAMVVIQVLLAEVQLDNFQEFGIELGLQDSILFDRSLAGVPGFLFNNQTLGNDVTAPAGNTGGQALSTFGVGRSNPLFGYGGLVLSASSESVSVLIRALRESRRLEVLARPQIMTLDNQPAQIQVGQIVSRVTGATQSNISSQINIQVTDVDVGLILGVVPRITPDGLVVMEIRATKSELGDEADGTPISVTETGETLRSPPINITTVETTIATPDGQTIILGGLITKTKSSTRRRIPFLSDIPLVKQLFRYDSDTVVRKELLIIMTPHIVRNQEDAEKIKQIEAARMHWCLGDVIELHGEIGMHGEGDLWADSETVVIYPDLDPDATGLPMLGEPHENPFRSEILPTPEPVPEFREEQFPEPPALRPSSGAQQAVPRTMPPGVPSPMRQVEQARYFGPPTWSDVTTAVYRDRDPQSQRPDLRPDLRRGAAGSVVPSAYQTPVVRRLPPVVTPASGPQDVRSVPQYR